MKDKLTLEELLPSTHIIWQANEQSKKRVFEQVSIFLENSHGLVRDELFRQLISRERLGSTSVGKQGAIPHVRLAGIKKPLCVLVRLEQAIPYDGDDDHVQTLFFLIVPEKANSTHLCLLAIFSEMLMDDQFMADLAQCQDATAAHQQIVVWETKNTNLLESIANPPQ